MIQWLILLVVLIGLIIAWRLFLGKFADDLPAMLKRIVPLFGVLILMFTTIDYLRINLGKRVIERISISGSQLGDNGILDDKTAGGVFAGEAQSFTDSVRPYINDVQAALALALAQGGDKEILLFTPELRFDPDLKLDAKNLERAFAFSDTLVEKVDVAGISIPIDALLHPIVRLLGQKRLRMNVIAGGGDRVITITSDTGDEVWRVTEPEAACLEGVLIACSDPAWKPASNQVLSVRRLLRASVARLMFQNSSKVAGDLSWIAKTALLEGRGLLNSLFARPLTDGKTGKSSFQTITHAQPELAVLAKRKFEVALHLTTVGKLADFSSDQDRDQVQTLALLGLMAAQGAEIEGRITKSFARVQNLDLALSNSAQLSAIVQHFEACEFIPEVFQNPRRTDGVRLGGETEIAEATKKAGRFYSKVIDEARRIRSSFQERRARNDPAEPDEFFSVLEGLLYTALLKRAVVYDCLYQRRLAIADLNVALQLLNSGDIKASEGDLRAAKALIGSRIARLEIKLGRFDEAKRRLEEILTDNALDLAIKAKPRRLLSDLLLDQPKSNLGQAEAILKAPLNELSKQPESSSVRHARILLLTGIARLYDVFDAKEARDVQEMLIGGQSNIRFRLSDDHILTRRVFSSLKTDKYFNNAMLENFSPSNRDRLKSVVQEVLDSSEAIPKLRQCYGDQAKTALIESREVFETLRQHGEWLPADLQTLSLIQAYTRRINDAGDHFKNLRSNKGEMFDYKPCFRG